MVLNEYILITNRGPNFKSGAFLHFGAGGTQDAYKILADKFAFKWFCLASDKLKTDTIISDYENKLSVQFIEDDLYNKYYYEFISEFLYPTLLGYSHLAIKKERINDFLKVNEILINSIRIASHKNKLIICDYHLFMLPQLIEWRCKKVFFWFLPFLPLEKHSTSIFKDIVYSLSFCDTIYFLTSSYASNFKKAYEFYFPKEKLQTKIFVNVFGPNKDYLDIKHLSQDSFDYLLYTKFNLTNNGSKFILSVSRLDFVKNIPVLIKAFSIMINCTENKNINLIIVAPHHRKDSSIYQLEEKNINELIKKSNFHKNIYLCNDLFSKDELKILYKYSDIFVLSSNYDAMPLTPLEYWLANNGHGDIIATNTTGTPNILKNCPTFSTNDECSLAKALINSIATSDEKKKKRINRYKVITKKYNHIRWLENIIKSI